MSKTRTQPQPSRPLAIALIPSHSTASGQSCTQEPGGPAFQEAPFWILQGSPEQTLINLLDQYGFVLSPPSPLAEIKSGAEVQCGHQEFETKVKTLPLNLPV